MTLSANAAKPFGPFILVSGTTHASVNVACNWLGRLAGITLEDPRDISGGQLRKMLLRERHDSKSPGVDLPLDPSRTALLNDSRLFTESKLCLFDCDFKFRELGLGDKSSLADFQRVELECERLRDSWSLGASNLLGANVDQSVDLGRAIGILVFRCYVVINLV